MGIGYMFKVLTPLDQVQSFSAYECTWRLPRTLEPEHPDAFPLAVLVSGLVSNAQQLAALCSDHEHEALRKDAGTMLAPAMLGWPVEFCQQHRLSSS